MVSLTRSTFTLAVLLPETDMDHAIPSQTPAMLGERSENFQKGKGSSRMSAMTPVEAISLLDSEDDDSRVNLVDNDSENVRVVPTCAAATVRLHHVGPEFKIADDDMLTMTVVEFATIHAHARADCPVHMFATDITGAAHEENRKFCDKCYCYVCDEEASKCKAWKAHCMATDNLAAWRDLRSRGKRSNTNKPIKVPLHLLPSKSRATSSSALKGAE